jgi:hypothetical protein
MLKFKDNFLKFVILNEVKDLFCLEMLSFCRSFATLRMTVFKQDDGFG